MPRHTSEVSITPPSPDLPKNRPNWGKWISTLVIAGLVVAMVIFVDVRHMAAVAMHTNLWLALAGVGFFLGGVALIDLRWWWLLGRNQDFWRLAHATHTSFIVPILTPIPNYISRVMVTGLVTEASLAQASTAMMVERMIAQILRISAIVLAISLGVQSSLTPNSMLRSVGMSVVVLVGYVLAIRFAQQVTLTIEQMSIVLHLSDRMRNKVVGFVSDALSVNVGIKEMLFALGMSLVMWGLFFLFHLLVILAMPLGFDVHACVIIALGTLALTPPSAPAMLGIYQVSQIGPNLILHLGTFEQLLPYSLWLYAIQAIVWLALTWWGVRKLDVRFRDLF